MAQIRLNPGGRLTPAEVIGRDAIIARLWQRLERQSVVLTAERRMGKTSLLRKMHAERPDDRVTVMRTLQDVTSPDDFVRHLLKDIEEAFPKLLPDDRTLPHRLLKAGVKKIGVARFNLEFEPAHADSWKVAATETFGVLDEHTDRDVVFLWDELPHMVASIAEHHGPLAGREVLDLLRAVRERHARLRMVLSGSLGLHHVMAGLGASGGAWAPVNDMLAVDLPPLAWADAAYLATELLRNEEVRCDDVAAVGAQVVRESNEVPFYVHLTVQALLDRQQADGDRPARAADVRPLIDDRLADSQDPWQLLHYVHRLKPYYGENEALVKAILDALAVATSPLTVPALRDRVGLAMAPPTTDALLEILDLLGKDHYVSTEGPAVGFRLELLRRAWIARRRLA